jgi:alpha-galactosidase
MTSKDFLPLRIDALWFLILFLILIWINPNPVFAQALAHGGPQSQTPTTLPTPEILTPPSPEIPLIHGPKVFGVHPGSPFLYTIPATGDRPMTFSAPGLPDGLKLDTATGQITGKLFQTGAFPITFHATNALGSADRAFKIIVGEEISLTPPMGWNSYNCFGTGITQQRELNAARDIVKANLDQHGWSYINMDGGWEGVRGGPYNAIQPNQKNFTDIKAMVDEIHKMGLKVGIYSSPWVTTYGGQVGGSSDNPDGFWDPKTMRQGIKNQKTFPYAIGKYHFFKNDAKQWAEWGFDYLKWDWNPNEVPETKEMYEALRATNRDFVFSLSNQTPFKELPGLLPYANCWRVSGDIGDHWNSLLSNAFNHDQWAPFARPGHWNDPDMFEIGANANGKPKRLTPDEQYTHVSLWCLLSSPLILGCDLDYLDAFTIGLLSNDEVIDVNQDELGKQATCVFKHGAIEIYAKPLSDGSWAVGLFNLGLTPASANVKWSYLNLAGAQIVRDLWRQQNLGRYADAFSAEVNAHGVALIKVSPTP